MFELGWDTETYESPQLKLGLLASIKVLSVITFPIPVDLSTLVSSSNFMHTSEMTTPFCTFSKE